MKFEHNVEESTDITTACKYCGRVCGTRLLKYRHEDDCLLNPKNMQYNPEGYFKGQRGDFKSES